MTTKPLPQPGQGLHGEPMGKPEPSMRLTPTGDEDVPNTPEQNLPPLEYAGEPDLPERGPIAENPQPVTAAPSSPLDRLPESVSAADVAAESRQRGNGGY
jgi:hypothetical protein